MSSLNIHPRMRKVFWSMLPVLVGVLIFLITGFAVQARQRGMGIDESLRFALHNIGITPTADILGFACLLILVMIFLLVIDRRVPEKKRRWSRDEFAGSTSARWGLSPTC